MKDRGVGGCPSSTMVDFWAWTPSLWGMSSEEKNEFIQSVERGGGWLNEFYFLWRPPLAASWAVILSTKGCSWGDGDTFSQPVPLTFHNIVMNTATQISNIFTSILPRKTVNFLFIKLVTFSFAFFLYVYQAMLSILYHLNFNVFQPLERESVHVKIDVINDFEHVAEINGTSSRCD